MEVGLLTPLPTPLITPLSTPLFTSLLTPLLTALLTPLLTPLLTAPSSQHPLMVPPGEGGLLIVRATAEAPLELDHHVHCACSKQAPK